MNLSEYREDLKKHETGAPVYIGDAVYYVRRFGTPESNKFLKELKLSLWGPFANHAEQEGNEVLGYWLAEYGVTGWENVFDVGDKPVIYSKMAALSVFANKEFWTSLNEKLINGALNFENFLHDQAEEDTEALKKP